MRLQAAVATAGHRNNPVEQVLESLKPAPGAPGCLGGARDPRPGPGGLVFGRVGSGAASFAKTNGGSPLVVRASGAGRRGVLPNGNAYAYRRDPQRRDAGGGR